MAALPQADRAVILLFLPAQSRPQPALPPHPFPPPVTARNRAAPRPADVFKQNIQPIIFYPVSFKKIIDSEKH
jgi:hypothetical protein